MTAATRSAPGTPSGARGSPIGLDEGKHSLPLQQLEPRSTKPPGRPKTTGGAFWAELLVAVLVFAGVAAAWETLTRARRTATQGRAVAADMERPGGGGGGGGGGERGGGGKGGVEGGEGVAGRRDGRSSSRKPSRRAGERSFVPHPTGELEVARGSGPRSGPGLLHRYVVEVEGGLGVSKMAFARAVDEVLSSPRGWGASGAIAFKRVDRGTASFRVTLASPGMTDRLCAPLVTGGIYSCNQGDRAVLNLWRWTHGADSFRDDLAGYRQYMINHEVGHALGHGHAYCSSTGAPAPVMLQQTKGVAGCKPNPWPLVSERP